MEIYFVDYTPELLHFFITSSTGDPFTISNLRMIWDFSSSSRQLHLRTYNIHAFSIGFIYSHSFNDVFKQYLAVITLLTLQIDIVYIMKNMMITP